MSKTEVVTYVGPDGSTDTRSKWGSGNDDPREYLTPGTEYDVMEREVHTWHTVIVLRDFPDKRFNSTHFDDEADR